MGNALAQPGGSELFAREEAVEDLAATDVLIVLEQQSGVLENPLLAGHVEVQQNVSAGQKLGDQVHVGAGRAGQRIIRGWCGAR